MKKSTSDWWRGAVIYQIYPRSYQDSNNDGIGDLAGITRRLPYIADLGVDAIWISPFYTSPMLDFGYDVSDYCDVDPMFGGLADFDALIKMAHHLGLKVMIDLVISHTSIEHPWFRESRQNSNNDKSDWYVWADAKPDGTPPNNWLSIFGGSAWQWDSRREQYYLHNFLVEQPDLNFHNPAVQKQMLSVAEFWLQRDVDGFRLDTVNFYFHDQYLRDNPPLPKALRNPSIAPSVNPYNHQLHLFSKTQPENMAFLAQFRALLDKYPDRTTVGEVGDAQFGKQIAADYTTGNDYLHMCYTFDLLSLQSPKACTWVEVLEQDKAINVDGWVCWALSNHDVVRHATRCSEKNGKFSRQTYLILMALQLSIRGSVCLYQGEELGLIEAEIAFEDLQDPYGIEFWPTFKGRDGCRTPMVWEKESDAGYAGFSDVKPWLPIADEHKRQAVDVQQEDSKGLLSAYKQFIAFRKTHPCLVKGDIDAICADGDVIQFTRSYQGKQCLCVFNLGENIQTIQLTATTTALSGHGFDFKKNGDTLTLAAGQAYFGRIA